MKEQRNREAKVGDRKKHPLNKAEEQRAEKKGERERWCREQQSTVVALNY